METAKPEEKAAPPLKKIKLQNLLQLQKLLQKKQSELPSAKAYGFRVQGFKGSSDQGISFLLLSNPGILDPRTLTAQEIKPKSLPNRGWFSRCYHVLQ